jgi:hypothetical protein
LRFSSSGGVNAGLNGSGTHFALDDMYVEFGQDCSDSPIEELELTPVPTMSEWALILLAMLLAFVGITAARRRV